jgi:hypothetical protein
LYLLRGHDLNARGTAIASLVTGVIVFLLVAGLEASFTGFWTGDATEADRLANALSPFGFMAGISAGLSVGDVYAVSGRLLGPGRIPVWLCIVLGPIAAIAFFYLVGAVLMRVR